MSSGPVRTILANINLPSKLNVLTTTEEPDYLRRLCNTGHNFYAIPSQNSKQWVGPIPSNLVFLPSNHEMPLYIDFNLMVLNSRLESYDNLFNIASFWHLPTILVDYHKSDTLNINPIHYNTIRNRQADIYVFVDEEVRDSWGGLGYIVKDEHFEQSWNNIFSQTAEIIYTR